MVEFGPVDAGGSSGGGCSSFNGSDGRIGVVMLCCTKSNGGFEEGDSGTHAGVCRLLVEERCLRSSRIDLVGGVALAGMKCLRNFLLRKVMRLEPSVLTKY